MRNYFKTLGLDKTASREVFKEALEQDHDAANALNPRHRADAFQVLLDAECCQVYTSAAELYETLSSAVHCLDEPEAQDTHQWHERLSEFDTTVQG